MPKVNMQAIISPKTVGAAAATADDGANSGGPQIANWYVWIGNPAEPPPGPLPPIVELDAVVCDLDVKGHGPNGNNQSGNYHQLHVIIGHW